MQMENEDEDGNLQRSYRHFWETFKYLESEEHKKYRNARTIASNAAKIKLEVQKAMCVIDATIARLNQNICQNEDGSLFHEVRGMLDDLNQLFVALELSDKEIENNISALGELLEG